MSHYLAFVLIDPDTDPQAEVSRLLAPYDENVEDFENGKWDWWVIGGRWTACLDREYDPTKDPQNYETCFLCRGTGVRPDAAQFGPDYAEKIGCNGCHGTGQELKHPPKWVRSPRDILPVREVDVEKTPFTMVLPDGSWIERESWVWDKQTEKGEMVTNFTEFEWRRFVPKTLREHHDKTLVVVDYHS